MNLRYLNFFFLFFAFQSCENGLFDAGNEVAKVTVIEDFSVIEAESTFEIEIVQDTVNKVMVTCGENLHRFIKIRVSDNTLFLKHDIKNNWSRNYEKVKLKLHAKPFERINVRKPVRIFNKGVYKAPVFTIVDFEKYSELDMNLDVDYCLVAMSSDNFGQFKVSGKAVNSQIWGWGSCSVRADSLVATNCNVHHRGMGKIYVNATNQLDVSIQFSGNVYYSGNPQVNVVSHTGSGQLIKK